jgi:23S rRNA (cytosine1962-C5)-methyltransferase
MSRVVLKPGKEKSVLRRHPWIFSGAIDKLPKFSNGDILPIYSAAGALLGSGYFHTENSIAGRILSFGVEDVHQAVRRKLKESLALRQALLSTDAYRLVNAEGDGLPGLIVDRYKNVLVLQINTAGMEKLKPFIVETLVSLLHPASIYEKSVSAARRQEGLPDFKGVVYGELIPEVTIHENGIPYRVSITEGQKTGFFLDQREMRKTVAGLSLGKRVLNCFAYTGGFSAAAIKGGASHVDSVEISEEACALCRRNIDSCLHTVVQADAFDFLRTSPLDYGLVILDPPAFAKKRGDIHTACQGYKEINRVCMKKMPENGLLLTCSCSSYIDDALFQNLISQAAAEANRFVRIIGRHVHAPDHPVSLFHPEGHYLKSLLLHIGGFNCD